MKKNLLGLCCMLVCFSLVKAYGFTPPRRNAILYVTAGTDFFILSGTTVSADSLVLVPSADFTINGNELTHNMAVTNIIDSPAINNAYLFANTTNVFNGTLKYKYAVAELNGLVESHLKQYIYNGTKWQLYYSATNATSSHYIVSVPLTGVVFNEISLTADSVELPFFNKPHANQPGSLTAQLFEIKAYPNPSVNVFHLKVSSGSPEVIHVIVSDMNGKRVKEMKMVPNESRELGAEFLNGMYIVEFIQGNTHKAIKLEKLQ